VKRKYREAMRAAARERDERPDDEALETRNWFDKWATTPTRQQHEESNNNQRSQE
jgi:hypothetical protein